MIAKANVISFFISVPKGLPRNLLQAFSHKRKWGGAFPPEAQDQAAAVGQVTAENQILAILITRKLSLKSKYIQAKQWEKTAKWNIFMFDRWKSRY